LYASAENFLKKSAKLIENRRKGRYAANRFLDIMLGILFVLLKTKYRNHLLKLSGLDNQASVEEAIYKADKIFSVDGQCYGCGTCVKIYPRNNTQSLADRSGLKRG
jgi:hypothetical protein